MCRLLDIAARCEAIDGPDREIDELITATLAGATREVQRDNSGIERSVYHRDGFWVSVGTVQPYTASIDSAMTLVPWDWLRKWNYLFTLEQERDGRWTARADQMGDECGIGDTIMSEPCAEKALAVTAFALRARAHQLSEPSPAQPDWRDG